MACGSDAKRQSLPTSLPTILEDLEWKSTDCGSDSDQDKSDIIGGSFSSETLVFFDWDDTLLPTTWLAEQGFLEGRSPRVNRKQQMLLQELEISVEGTLLTAMTHGRVVIVTNSAAGWVEDSCNTFLPGLRPLLDDLDIISARSIYEKASSCPMEWKRLAFQDVIDAHFEGRGMDERRNIISIGDSMYEHVAFSAATESMPSCHAKSLKLMERPKVEQLIDEHRLLGEELTQAVLKEACLDLEITTELS